MLAAFFGVLALNLFAPPQTQTQTAPSNLPDVVVSGTRHTPREARRFVDEISTAPTHALTLATWMTPICLGVINLKAEAAAAIVARVEAEAAEVGVPVASAGCRPNVTVLATSDGRFTASDLVAAFGDRFILSPGSTQGDREDLRRFADSDAPVRWWTISALMDEDSKQILVAVGDGSAPTQDTTGEVFFGQNRRDGMLASLVILDLSKMNGVPDVALGDYVAMVVLANIDPEARPRRYPTILNLWREGEAVAGLTPWDRAYLRALYQAPVRLSGSGLQTRSLYQLNEMARLMSVQLDAEARPAP